MYKGAIRLWIEPTNEQSLKNSIPSWLDITTELTASFLSYFEWDVLYHFSGDASTEHIDNILGFKGDLQPTGQEDRSHIVFVKDSKIVCHVINGDDKEYYFDFIYDEAIDNTQTLDVTKQEGCVILSVQPDDDIDE